jgi:short subunit dehydrogenase-like uncharacterized protein
MQNMAIKERIAAGDASEISEPDEQVSRRFECIVFGATGSAGRQVVRQLLQFNKKTAGKKIEFAVAGRSAFALKIISKNLKAEGLSKKFNISSLH